MICVSLRTGLPYFFQPILLTFFQSSTSKAAGKLTRPDSLSRPISDSQDRNKKEASAQVEKSLRGLPHHPSTH